MTIGSIAYNPAYAWAGHYNVNRDYSVNGLNQQTSAGATALGYDARGNLVTSGTSTYGYDKLGRMISAPGVNLGYDAAGRLSKYVGSTGAVRFSYAGSALIQETYDPGGPIIRRYVPGPGMDEPVVWYEGSGTADRRWLHADERGSVIAISDGAGAMLAINRYDEYGIPEAGGAGRFRYTGQVWLGELGLYYYKARMYSPSLGRFMQTDPIGYGDGMNWYNYVGSDPVNFRDPSGLSGSISCMEYPTGYDQWWWNEKNGWFRGKFHQTGTAEFCSGNDYGLHTLGGNLVGGNSANQAKPPCAQRSSRGVCIQVRLPNGTLQITEEWKRLTCNSAARAQATGSAISDTVGLPPVGGAAGAATAAGAERAGLPHPVRAGVGGSIYMWFIGLVAQTATGQGFRPFGLQIVPKVDLSMCSN